MLFAVVGGSLSAAPVKSEIADAAMRGDTAAVRALLAKKVDVNAPQNDGSTALHWAVLSRRTSSWPNLLMRAGANVKAANREGVDAAVAGQHERRCRRRLARCSKAGADANEKLPLGRTPLMIAVAHRQRRRP